MSDPLTDYAKERRQRAQKQRDNVCRYCPCWVSVESTMLSQKLSLTIHERCAALVPLDECEMTREDHAAIHDCIDGEGRLVCRDETTHRQMLRHQQGFIDEGQ